MSNLKNILIIYYAFVGFGTNALAQVPPTISVSVKASESKGNPLQYRWAVTDGTIQSASGPIMTWRLPSGRGLHFAYVLVSNGKGGYLERRIAVSLDAIGVPTAPSAALALVPPPAPERGNYFTGVIRGSKYVSPIVDYSRLQDAAIYQEGGEAYLQNSTGVRSVVVTSDRRGFFTIPDLNNGSYTLFTRPDQKSSFVDRGSEFINGESIFDGFSGEQGRRGINGRLLLSDGTPCGTNNEFFKVFSGGSVTLLDISGKSVEGPVKVNADGFFAFNSSSTTGSIRLSCEGARSIQVRVPAANKSARVLLTDTTAPTVSSMSALFNGRQVGLFLPPPKGLPSDNNLRSEAFLTFRGIDTKLSGCRYYFAIGATKSCDANGNLGQTITFDDWKKQSGLAPFVRSGGREVSATFINRVDLNLTRNHHSITYDAKNTAAYVCNHLGPENESITAINLAIDNAVAGRNLVACVAMDFRSYPGVNNNKPFTRFLIFSPSGKLLPSVNLDGRGEKFVPGVCVACHGGRKYSGKFPEAASTGRNPGSADIGAGFLPYDAGNFSFSTKTVLTRNRQEEAIYQLNNNILTTDPTIAAKELIAGWYKSSHVQNNEFVPLSWKNRSTNDQNFYKHVYATYCRTCHVNFSETLNFDHYENIAGNATDPHGKLFNTSITACGGDFISNSWYRNLSMPNSLRTFDLLWSTKGSTNDASLYMQRFLSERLTQATGSQIVANCTLRKWPDP